ncbi:MAG: hypothetical protein M1818_002855 [Claussenomyces sp. TS43310]|nr:MAG: hypothetical protein M1818_002855 [Claussenomyces sp. TS43310]
MLESSYGSSLFAAAVVGIASVLISFLLPICIRAVKLYKIPLVGKEPGEWFDTKARLRQGQNFRQIVEEGLKKFPGGFQIVGDNARQVVIPPQYINVVNRDTRLSTTEPIDAFLKLSFSGFEGSRSILGDQPSRYMFINMLKTKVNQNLGSLTEPLADEANGAFADIWGLDSEWHEIALSPTLCDVVSRLTTRVFMGPELCHNPEWLRIIVEYAINTFNCARALRRYPDVLARVVQWFSKDCRILREQVSTTRRLLAPFIEEHLKKVELAKQGLAEMPNDAVVWLHEVANGQAYDPVTMQLGVSVTAIHTTTDLLTQSILDIVANPEIIEPLRKEIEEVVREHGWGKTTLQKMKLLDSAVKETQRLKPASGGDYAHMFPEFVPVSNSVTATTGRFAREEITLPNGLVIPKGTFAFSSMQRMWDDEYYPSQEKWDGYRFLRMRSEPGRESSCQLVTTSPEHLGFGHGVHACPGRFLASNEVKMILSHILMNYDFECVGEIPKPLVNGLEFMSDPSARLRVRKRQT